MTLQSFIPPPSTCRLYLQAQFIFGSGSGAGYCLLGFYFSLSRGEVAAFPASAPSLASAPVGFLLLGGSLVYSGRGISFGALREQRRSALFRAASMDFSAGLFLQTDVDD